MFFKTKGDPIADLYEDIAAEEKARATYQWIINLSDDPDLNDGLKYLREREIIHSQRFREAVEILKEERDKQLYF
ncbi:manganese catalase family protein, partial [Pontibacillus litoralis]